MNLGDTIEPSTVFHCSVPNSSSSNPGLGLASFKTRTSVSKDLNTSVHKGIASSDVPVQPLSRLGSQRRVTCPSVLRAPWGTGCPLSLCQERGFPLLSIEPSVVGASSHRCLGKEVRLDPPPQQPAPLCAGAPRRGLLWSLLAWGAQPPLLWGYSESAPIFKVSH